MAVTKPTPGQEDWDVPLDAALDALDASATAANVTAEAAETAAAAAAVDADDAATDAASAAAAAAAAEAAVAGKLDAAIVRVAPGATIQRIDLNYIPDTSDPDLFAIFENAVQVSWRNERGHYRARVSEDALWDSTFRAIQVTGQTGSPFEYENVARTDRIWAIDPDDGATKRFDIKMSDVLVLGSADPVPADTPSGTVIMRTA